MNSMYFDKEGKPLDTMEWAELFEKKGYRIIEQTQFDAHNVSTVWTGLNSGWIDREEPHSIFETMIFAGKDRKEPDDMECVQWRYATLTEAQAGHKKACDLVRDLKKEIKE